MHGVFTVLLLLWTLVVVQQVSLNIAAVRLRCIGYRCFFSLSLCSYICVYWMTPDGIVPLDVCLAVSGFVCGPIFARRLFGLELIADELL